MLSDAKKDRPKKKRDDFNSYNMEFPLTALYDGTAYLFFELYHECFLCYNTLGVSNLAISSMNSEGRCINGFRGFFVAIFGLS